MLSEVNTYPEQGGRRFNSKVIRSWVPQLEAATTSTLHGLDTVSYAQTNAADSTNQTVRTGTLGKSRQMKPEVGTL